MPQPHEMRTEPERHGRHTGRRSNQWFTLRVGASIIVDYTAFHQDEASISQVGEQRDQWQARELRFTLRGSVGNEYKVNYYFTTEYNGFDGDPGRRWSFVDAWLSFPLGSPATLLTVGKTKETFDYEVVSSFPTLPQQERILSPFFVSRNIGAKISQVLANQRMTLSAGAFNDWWTTKDTLKESGTDFSARLTGLVWDQEETSHYLHLAIAGRYVGADDNTLRYGTVSSSTESNADKIREAVKKIVAKLPNAPSAPIAGNL